MKMWKLLVILSIYEIAKNNGRNLAEIWYLSGAKNVNLVDLLAFSNDGELRDIQEEFSEYVRYVLRWLVHIFIFQSLSMSLFLNLRFEPDPYSNEYLVAKIGVDTVENVRLKIWTLEMI